MDQSCHCGSGVPFAECCERYLSGRESAPTAEALMRSRYSAFCEGAADYLLRTQHPDSRSDEIRDKLEKSFSEAQWLNLIVLSTQQGGPRHETGIVEFVAAFRPKQNNVLMAEASEGDAGITQLHESSRFIRDEGDWVYVEGEQLPPYRTKRGEPCWCGSGRKTRQCHG